jgi:hypothetical protein
MPGRENADQRDHHKSRMADGPGHRGCRGITGNARAQAKAQTHPIPAEKFVRQVEKKTVRHVRHDTNSEFRVPKSLYSVLTYGRYEWNHGPVVNSSEIVIIILSSFALDIRGPSMHWAGGWHGVGHVKCPRPAPGRPCSRSRLVLSRAHSPRKGNQPEK